MTLHEYLESTTQEAFAEKLGVSQGLVHQWLNWLAKKTRNATKITAERAVQIEIATEGRVRKASLRPDIFPEYQQLNTPSTARASQNQLETAAGRLQPVGAQP